MKSIRVLLMLSSVISLSISCSGPADGYKPAASPMVRSSKPAYTSGVNQSLDYPKPAHVFAAKHSSVWQLYLGAKRPPEQIALIGRYTWLDGNRRLYIRRIANSQGEQWIYPNSRGADHFEVIPDEYELTLATDKSNQITTVTVTAEPCATYALYPDGVKNVGTDIMIQLRKNESSRSINLTDAPDLKNSRWLSVQYVASTRKHSGPEGSLTMTVTTSAMFYANHSVRTEVEAALGKPTSLEEKDGLTHCFYQQVVYGTELDKKTLGRDWFNRSARPLCLAFDANSILIKIVDSFGSPGFTVDIRQDWEDFMHYSKMGRHDLAAPYLQKVLNAQPNRNQLLAVMKKDDGRFIRHFRRNTSDAEYLRQTKQLLDIIDDNRAANTASRPDRMNNKYPH